MIIDCHTHIYNEKIYAEYKKAMAGKKFKAMVLDWKRANSKNIFEFTESKDNLFYIGTVNMYAGVKSQLKDLEVLFKGNNAFGIKIYPGYESFYPCDKKVFPIAKLCIKYNRPLIFHSGDFWDEDGSALLKYSHPIHVDELASRFPECKIIISHFGFPYFLEAANVASKNKNVYTDISGTIDRPSDKQALQRLLTHYQADLERAFAYFPDVKMKILFATDYCGPDTPLDQVKPYLKIAKKLFTKKEQESLFFGLANKLFFS